MWKWCTSHGHVGSKLNTLCKIKQICSYIWIKNPACALPLLVELMGKKNSKDEIAIPTYIDTCMGILMCTCLIFLLIPPV